MLMSQSKEGTFPGDVEALLPFADACSPGGFPEHHEGLVQTMRVSPAPRGPSRAAPELLLWEGTAKGAQLSSSCPCWHPAPSPAPPCPTRGTTGEGKSEEKQGEGDGDEYKESTRSVLGQRDRDA